MSHLSATAYQPDVSPDEFTSPHALREPPKSRMSWLLDTPPRGRHTRELHLFPRLDPLQITHITMIWCGIARFIHSRVRHRCDTSSD